MAIFRLLHASDLHIAVKPRKIGLADLLVAGFYNLPQLATASSHDPDLLIGLARLAYHRRQSLDAVLLSGDLATTGNTSDLDKAFAFVDLPATSLWWTANCKPTLQGSGLPVFLIPGNHDRFTGRWHLPGGKEFDQIFRKYWHPSQCVQTLGALSKQNSFLALIGADLTLRHKSHARGRLGKWGQGKVYRGPLAELERCTQRLRTANPDTGIIWVVHFPPAFPEREQALDLIDGAKLTNAAKAQQVSVILTGHTHNPKHYPILPVTGSNDIEILCAGTATQHIAPVGHVVHIIEVEVLNGGRITIGRQDLWWRENDNNFV